MSPQRTLWSDLRAIDRAVVPRLASVFDRLQRAVRDLPRTLSAGAGGFRATTDRLDRRYAGHGLLGLVRDVPQVGLALLGLLLVLSASTVLARVGDEGNVFDDPSTVTGRASTVGPFPGEPVAGYLADARARLARLAEDDPDRRLHAIASFEAPVTAEEAATALPGADHLLLFLDVAAPSEQPCLPSQAKPVEGLPAGAAEPFGALADCLEREADDLERQAASIVPTDPSQAREKASEERDVRRSRATIADLRAGCACIVAVVVRAESQLLVNIANSGAVRIVDPAEPDLSFTSISWVPLPPEVTGTVPIPTTPPGPVEESP